MLLLPLLLLLLVLLVLLRCGCLRLKLLLRAGGLDNKVNERRALSLASWYSQQGRTMCPEGATSSWKVSEPSGSPRSNS